MHPKTPSFAILLTTYKRPALVLRAIQSVFDQNDSAWELVLVNDSPGDDYTEAEALIRGRENVTYIQNEINSGKNASLTRSFDHLRKKNFTGYVVFLDDDDWLAPDCLATFASAIAQSNSPWIVSARAECSGTFFMKNRTGRTTINYYPDYLLTKRFSGDATHCIRFQDAALCSFAESVKNGEEWFFFSQVARQCPSFIYISCIGTYSEGYLPGGLTRITLSIPEKVRLYKRLCCELSRKRQWSTPVAIYMFLRFGKIFI